MTETHTSDDVPGPVAEPDSRLWDLFELLLIGPILIRGAANQLGYLWITGHHPTCRHVDVHVVGMPVALWADEIEPWGRKWVHLTSTFVAIIIPAIIFMWGFQPALPRSPVLAVPWLYVTLQWLWLLLWDPVVLLTRGPQPLEHREVTE